MSEFKLPPFSPSCVVFTSRLPTARADRRAERRLHLVVCLLDHARVPFRRVVRKMKPFRNCAVYWVPRSEFAAVRAAVAEVPGAGRYAALRVRGAYINVSPMSFLSPIVTPYLRASGAPHASSHA